MAGDKLLQQARRQYVHILRPYWRLSVTSGAQARQMAVVAEYGSMCSLFSVQKVCRHRNSAIATWNDTHMMCAHVSVSGSTCWTAVGKPTCPSHKITPIAQLRISGDAECLYVPHFWANNPHKKNWKILQQSLSRLCTNFTLRCGFTLARCHIKFHYFLGNPSPVYWSLLSPLF